jgi:hypothetical protein
MTQTVSRRVQQRPGPLSLRSANSAPCEVPPAPAPIQAVGAPPERHADRITAEMMRHLVAELHSKILKSSAIRITQGFWKLTWCLRSIPSSCFSEILFTGSTGHQDNLAHGLADMR